jgi:hypothetical protein
MGALVQLGASSLAVEPGRTATTEVTVRNTGSVVDRFTFEALGAAAAWVTFEPDALSLFPQSTGTVSVQVAPPRTSDVPAGPLPLGIRADSGEDPEGSAAEEMTLEVAAFSAVSMELLPRLTHGRYAGLARVAVDNRSNIAYEATVAAADPSNSLRFAFRPPLVSVPPGGAQFVRARIRPVKAFWRGPAVQKPFRVSLASDTRPHPPKVEADGALVQEALLPRWLLWVIAGLVALAALAVLLWFTVLKPQIRSSATDAVKSQLAANAATPSQPSTASSPAGGAPSGAGGATTSPTNAPPATSAAGTAAGSDAQTVDGSGLASGNGSQVIYTVPAGRTLQVTDLLIQNAAGDNGVLSLARNGTVLMQWSMADFRDLDYHWVSPTVFGPGAKLVMTVSGCAAACHPGVYYAGNLVNG